MTEKEMIEEMAVIALKNTMTYTCAKQIATNFYNAGYRKIPEGGAILSKEENEKWVEWLEMNIKKARKEMAREIIQLLDGHQFEDDGWTWSVSKRDLKFIAKKYGVEIEGGNEND